MRTSMLLRHCLAVSVFALFAVLLAGMASSEPPLSDTVLAQLAACNRSAWRESLEVLAGGRLSVKGELRLKTTAGLLEDWDERRFECFAKNGVHPRRPLEGGTR